MIQQINDIFKFPERGLVNKRITKVFFKRNFDLTVSDKTLLDDFNIVMNIDWLATLNPNTTNVPGYVDDVSTFEELQVIGIQIGIIDFQRNSQRVAELVQKYIPYHLVLCIYSSELFLLNTCDKRINQNDSNRRTIERRFFTEMIDSNEKHDKQIKFLESLSFDQLDKTNLKTLYDSYTQRIIALQAADVSGIFLPRSQSRTAKDMLHLEQIEILSAEIAALQSKAKKETQLAVRVELNTQIQQKRKQVEHLKQILTA